MIQQQKKLTETKQALYDALHKQRKINEDLEHIKKEKEKLSETVLLYKLLYSYVGFSLYTRKLHGIPE